ncbi:MAG: type I-C CRISPR-associated protein Cas8c/Csd1 [Lachnospiraceae bacterium]|nr:type I-C CRISPR-associated protein Cas8c/Csd1 [Lachnospiraceae bacterium]
MILKELYDYYDILATSGDTGISPYGFEMALASYEALLSKEGVLVGLKAFMTEDGKPAKMSFMTPIKMKKKGIAASPVLDNFEYVFGVGGKNGDKKTEKIKFKAAKELHLSMFGQAKSEEAIAIARFFEQWDIDKAWENEHILSVYNEKGNAFNGNVVFRLSGKLVSGKVQYFHDTEEIKEIWLRENEAKNNLKNKDVRQCSITGEFLPIAQLHPQFSGVKGANPTGASLVCFNKDADMSYNLEQSFNAAVSQKASFKYSTALRYMLAGNKQRMFVGDDTTVFWASSSNPTFADAFYLMFNPPDENDKKEDKNERKVDRTTEEWIKAVLSDSQKGVYQELPGADQDVSFCVLGLSPNAGRISVRYFYRNSFRYFCGKIKQHYDDMRIVGKLPYIKVDNLLYATISSKSKDKSFNPLLGGAVVRAILTGEMYPRILLNQVILRSKTEAMVTQARAAAIKGFLVRKSRMIKKGENIFMSLNEESTNTAYVLGRTFAILEKIQKDALGDINSTIKDKYFASACSNPSLVFPNLLKLAQHHIAKLDGTYLNILLGKCLSLIEGDVFPSTLNMENQGRFILGYYQQNQNLYTKREQNNSKEENI